MIQSHKKYQKNSAAFFPGGWCDIKALVQPELEIPDPFSLPQPEPLNNRTELA
jgi:hypothetical protein